MQRTQWMKESIRAGKEFHIRNQSPLKNNVINIIASILLWGTGGLMLLLPSATPGYLWPLWATILGSCFFGHFILIIHECSHNMFLHFSDAKQAKKWNGLIGRIAGVPVFTDYVRHWEEGHVVHHLRPCEADDPQNLDPLYGKRLLKKIAIVWFIPFGFLTANPSSKYPNQLRRIILGVSTLIPIVYAVYLYHPPTLIVLYVSFLVLPTLNLCKIAQEHGANLQFEPDPLLRSRSYFYPLQWLFSPFNINYHYEHHANFNVPWYRLPKYHKILRTVLPEDVQPYYFHHEYVAQLMGTKELPPRSLIGIFEEDIVK